MTAKRYLGAATVITFGIWLVGLALGRARYVSYLPHKLLANTAGYLVRAALQEVVIQSYFFVRLEKLLGSGKRARNWTAVVFALCHFPNPLLMGIAWVSGWVACDIFRRHRNLWVLMAAHGIIGSALATLLPPWLMIAGIGFWPYVVQFYHFILGS
jgi:hypothetical protein